MSARWLEITADYRCNNRCLGCFAVRDEGPSMAPAEIVAALARGRNEGATGLWLGGGEPTLRRDLLATVKAARRMGYARVKLQTNGMLLAYEDFARRCREAGVTEVAFSVKGSTAALHDELARTPGCHAQMLAGMVNARAQGLALEADLLAYRRNVDDLPAMVGVGLAQGVERFRVWSLSAADDASEEVRAEVPRLSAVARAVARCLAENPALPPGALASLHTPVCVLPQEARGARFSARALGLLVVNPGGHAFRLEDSPMEGGLYLPGCAQCSERPTCGGLRRDYLALHGGGEFVPLERGV